MLGRRSLSLPLFPFDTELERTLRHARNPLRRHNNLENMVEENNNPPMALRDHFLPKTYTPPSCIQYPQVTHTHFEIKPSTISMLPNFYGNPNEDPYKHLNEFLEVCSTIMIQGLNDDALKLRLFPFSLKDKAKYWLSSLDRKSVV